MWNFAFRLRWHKINSVLNTFHTKIVNKLPCNIIYVPKCCDKEKERTTRLWTWRLTFRNSDLYSQHRNWAFRNRLYPIFDVESLLCERCVSTWNRVWAKKNTFCIRLYVVIKLKSYENKKKINIRRTIPVFLKRSKSNYPANGVSIQLI